MKFSLFSSIKGRQVISLWASKIFEKSGIKRLFGLNLVAAVVLTGVITPEATNLLNQKLIEAKTNSTPIAAEITTKTTFENPLADFKLSQFFSFWHPGIDLVDPEGTPIYAIEAGVVSYAGDNIFGYGKNVILNHDRNISSLYGHMSKIETVTGRRVARGELIGRVGSTGWATGNHLHLEIYYNGVPINPLEVLPITAENVKYDGIIYKSASASSTLSTNSL